MQVVRRHGWTADIAEALGIQRRLAAEVSRQGRVISPRFIAGVDISADRRTGAGKAAVVVLSYPSLEVAEVQTFDGKITFPYVPGLLSFREMPLIIPAFEKLKTVPDLVMVDGQGIAHPRRIGIASHLGLFLNIPTIGCAKSRLIGKYSELDNTPGSWSRLNDGGEVIGAVLRTKANVKPVWVSTGHIIDLEDAVRWVMATCKGYRLPEPTRLAHQAAGSGISNPGKQQLKTQI